MEKYILRECQIKYRKFKKVRTIQVKSPESVYKWFKSLQDDSVEKFITVYLNSSNEVICFNMDFIGGDNFVSFDPKVTVRNALLNCAVGIIIVHNHPSGSLNFSDDDIAVAKKLKEACEIVNLNLLDSIIIGYKGYKSLSEDRKL